MFTAKCTVNVLKNKVLKNDLYQVKCIKNVKSIFFSIWQGNQNK